MSSIKHNAHPLNAPNYLCWDPDLRKLFISPSNLKKLTSSESLSYKLIASSLTLQNRPNLNATPETQLEIWHPTFSNIQNQPLTVKDSVMYNFANATAVAERLITPLDERILGERSDLDIIGDSMALSVQASTVSSIMARLFHARTIEVQGLCDQVTRFQGLLNGAYRRMRILREENRELQRIVNSYSNNLKPRVKALERFVGQIIEQHERILNGPQVNLQLTPQVLPEMLLLSSKNL